MITPSPTPGAEPTKTGVAEQAPQAPQKTAVQLPQTPVSITKKQLSLTPTPAPKQEQPPLMVLTQTQITSTPMPTPVKLPNQPPYVPELPTFLSPLPPPTSKTPKTLAAASPGVKSPEKPKPSPVTATAPSAPAPVPTPTPAVTKMHDAWPDFKDLLQATWSSIIAHEALKQKDGNTSAVPGSARSLWPKPVHVAGGDYYCL
ncbi:hypothetical protein F4679DRAFT_530193 [Xylaria curta]|nr:hypothetical protein F4679DRAFT_530193 [Xylaria curta]